LAWTASAKTSKALKGFDTDANDAALDLSEQEHLDNSFAGGGDKDLLP